VAVSTGNAFNGAASGNWLTGWGAGDWAAVADVTGQ
jgi:hypothetical protein